LAVLEHEVAGSVGLPTETTHAGIAGATITIGRALAWWLGAAGISACARRTTVAIDSARTDVARVARTTSHQRARVVRIGWSRVATDRVIADNRVTVDGGVAPYTYRVAASAIAVRTETKVGEIAQLVRARRQQENCNEEEATRAHDSFILASCAADERQFTVGRRLSCDVGRCASSRLTGGAT
jgi:hypothetical protein